MMYDDSAKRSVKADYTICQKESTSRGTTFHLMYDGLVLAGVNGGV